MNFRQIMTIAAGLYVLGAEAGTADELAPRMEELMAPVTAYRRRASSCPAGWKAAGWTTYFSYPCCCEHYGEAIAEGPNKDYPTKPDNCKIDKDVHKCKNPDYDSSCSKDECANYSGCKYGGDFAHVSHKSPKYVRDNNIIAFYVNPAKHAGEKNSDYANKKIKLMHGTKKFTVKAIDTCADTDCGNCCSTNAGDAGYLVDLEHYALVRNLGKKTCWNDAKSKFDDCKLGSDETPAETICWKLA